jgi:hypothetical protein
MRSRSENCFTRNKSPLSKNHRRQARNERRTGSRNSRLIPIRSKQIRHKSQRKHLSNRKRSRSANTHRPDDNLSHTRTTSKKGTLSAFLPNLQNNPRKRINVPALSERTRNFDGNMHFLQLNLTQKHFFELKLSETP